MRNLSRQDLVDILHGAAILGAGGGGEISEGLEYIDASIAAGKTFTLATLDEAPDTALACTPYLLGAISELPPEEEALYSGLPEASEPPILSAYDRFERHIGQEFYGTLACEMGGTNTAIAFFCAAMRGAVTLDADPAGRAVPEITHSTYYLNNLPAAPIVVANQFGETVIYEGVKDDARAETLVRALARVSRNDVAAIDHALPIHQLRDALIPGTMTRALELGRVWRETKDPQAIARQGGGKVVYEGQVSHADWETREGFTYGRIKIDEAYEIAYKNEHMAAWLDGEVHASIPDIICLIDKQTGDPVTNPHAYVGQQVAVLILPAPAPFLTPRGLEAFGPAYAGLDTPFVSPLS